jgi:hypothetical protein
LNALLGEYAKIRNQAGEYCVSWFWQISAHWLDDYMDTITDKLGLVGVPTSR